MHAHACMNGRRDARDARNAGGMDEKKKRRDRSVFRCRASVSRARRREERRVWSDGWMDELSTTGRDGTGRGEDAKTRTTD